MHPDKEERNVEPFTIRKGILEVHRDFEVVRLSPNEAEIRRLGSAHTRKATIPDSKEPTPSADGSVVRVRCVCRGRGGGQCALVIEGRQIVCKSTDDSCLGEDCVIERIVLQ